jgi:hypothetical protein
VRFHSPLSSPLFSDPTWSMAFGERAALLALVADLQPGLALEVGTYHGGALRRIAEHASEVHSFDIDPEHGVHAEALPNATFHLGDSAETLPRVLAELAGAGRHVDFALVDGLHTYDAVLADARALLASDACRHTTIVFHDSANGAVRAALEDLDLPSHPKVAAAILDFVPGYLVRPDATASAGEQWNGLGLVILDENPPRPAITNQPERENVADVYRAFRERSAA